MGDRVYGRAGYTLELATFTTSATTDASTPIRSPSGYACFQASIAGTTSATDFVATVTVEGSNVSSASYFQPIGTIALAATGATTVGHSGSVSADIPWAWLRASVTGLTGLNSTCEVWMGF